MQTQLLSTGENLAMKLLVIVIVLLLVLGSFLADYKWKQWLARQQAARERDVHGQNPDHDRF